LITSCRMPNVFRMLGALSKRVRPQAWFDRWTHHYNKYCQVKTFKSNNPMLIEETHMERDRDSLLEEICAILPTMSWLYGLWKARLHSKKDAQLIGL
jgi:hypothetical protein